MRHFLVNKLIRNHLSPLLAVLLCILKSSSGIPGRSGGSKPHQKLGYTQKMSRESISKPIILTDIARGRIRDYLIVGRPRWPPPTHPSGL